MDKRYSIRSGRKARAGRAPAVVLPGDGGWAAGSGSTATGTGGAGETHSHANKATLDKLGLDTDGYLTAGGERARVGYADKAGELAEGSEVWNEFLSKRHDDRAAGVITFDKWTEYGQYTPGSGGAFMGMTAGGSLMEADYVKVRKKAQFETLEIAEVRYVGGKLVVSPGDGVEITGVERAAGGWRCLYKGSEDDAEGGRRQVHGKFRAGDLIYCHTTNLKNGELGQRYWWRECTGAGDGWFELGALPWQSDTGSDEPIAGDRCAQLGNRSDRERQSAIILAAAEPGASPLLGLYGGIDDFTLEGKDHVTMGAGADGVPFMTVYGRAYIGRRDRSTYVSYTPEGGVEIKARISAESAVGDTTLGEIAARLEDMGADGVLTPEEKRQACLALIEIREEYARISAAAEGAGIDHEDYDEAYYGLLKYLTGEGRRVQYLTLESGGRLLMEDGSGLRLETHGVLSNPGAATAVDRAEYEGYFRRYYSERDRLTTEEPVYDRTKTVIDGGVITSGTIQLAGDNTEGSVKAGITGAGTDDDDVRIWAGASYEGRGQAPFRVTQGGRLYATEAKIEGAVTARSLVLGAGAVIVSANLAAGTAIELPGVPEGCVRTVEVWHVFTSRSSNTTIAYIGATDLVHVDMNIHDMNQCHTHAYEMSGTGTYRLIGMKCNGGTYWNIVPYAFSGSGDEYTGTPSDIIALDQLDYSQL